MSAAPPDPKDPAKQSWTGAAVWAALACLFALGLLFYSSTVGPEKKGFYYVTAAVGGIVAVVNGYSAWTLYNKSKTPK